LIQSRSSAPCRSGFGTLRTKAFLERSEVETENPLLVFTRRTIFSGEWRARVFNGVGMQLLGGVGGVFWKSDILDDHNFDGRVRWVLIKYTSVVRMELAQDHGQWRALLLWKLFDQKISLPQFI
jgi:hypothetical protein